MNTNPYSPSKWFTTPGLQNPPTQLKEQQPQRQRQSQYEQQSPRQHIPLIPPTTPQIHYQQQPTDQDHYMLQQMFQQYWHDLSLSGGNVPSIPPPQHLYAFLQQIFRRSGIESNRQSQSISGPKPVIIAETSNSHSMASLTGVNMISSSSQMSEIQDLSVPQCDSLSELNNSAEPGNWTTLLSPSTNSSPTELNSSTLQYTPTDLTQQQPPPPQQQQQHHRALDVKSSRPDDILTRTGFASLALMAQTHPVIPFPSRDPSTMQMNQPMSQKTPTWKKSVPSSPHRPVSDIFRTTAPASSTPSPIHTPPTEIFQRQAFEHYYLTMIQRQYCLLVYQNLLQNLTVHGTRIPTETATAAMTSTAAAAATTTTTAKTTLANTNNQTTMSQTNPLRASSNSFSSHRNSRARPQLVPQSPSVQPLFKCHGRSRYHVQSHEPFKSISFDTSIISDPAADATTEGFTYECKLCHKTYNQASALKMHVRTHTLPCRCAHCGKSFSRKWLLKGHERTHTGERPYACNLCTRSFADRSNLRAHMQTHQREKRYSCPNCPRSFSRMGLLNKHMIQCRALNNTYDEISTTRISRLKSVEYSN
ncbi:Protein escargot [Fasciola hepatica]|uniref:Protein escargot n=1 Tax=Fasciola hepatica TaxID=6192 RepID=A0A4E0RCV1_FASHE|nr:Protein escargot [Fasciola hepatica]